jgi:hypothetical protein
VAAQVGFVLITRRILSIFGELDGKAVIRTAMQARPEALHHDPSAQFQVLDGHEGLGVDQARRVRAPRPV